MPRYVYNSTGRRNNAHHGFNNRSGAASSGGSRSFVSWTSSSSSTGGRSFYESSGSFLNMGLLDGDFARRFLGTHGGGEPRRRRRTLGTRRYYTYTAEDVTATRPEPEDDDVEEMAPKPDPVRTLTVRKVDLNLKENGAAHRTSQYDISDVEQERPKLVVRRGQSFTMDILFNRCYDPVNDDLKLSFRAGDQPMKSKGTDVEILLSDKDEANKWGAKILSNEGLNLSLTVFTPSSMYVGKWAMCVQVVEKDESSDTASSNVYSYIHPDPIYFIFNPWCKDDGVFLDNEIQLKEYVMNEFGKIFAGTAGNITAKPWKFGQFDSHVLDVALYLIEAGGLRWTSRGSPIAVVRKLTAMINSSDDGGVLTGNWSGNYSGGKSPLSWTGSTAILDRYWKSKEPVRYGQCWVFSGVTTTLARALGIPARSVTNFSSAHDTDGSITIDYHFDSLGEPIESGSDDSIWNFHVWNDVWMARPDLPTGYDGWQAVDATPQEASDGVYVCGPVSLEAIRKGEVNLPYDAPFVFAEVNADIMHWVYNSDGVMEPTGLKKDAVGKCISTKAINSNSREDITHQYKAAEGSKDERAAVLRANLTGGAKENILYGTMAEDVSFTVEQDVENTWVGGDFVVGLRMKNTSSKLRTITGHVVIKTVFYTGLTGEKVKSQALSDSPIVIKPGKESVQKTAVKSIEYLDKLKDCCMIEVNYNVKVKETGKVFVAKENFRLRKPHLTIKSPSEATVGQQFMVELSFANPLARMLTECVVDIDGLSTDLSFPQSNVSAMGTFSTKIPVTPTKGGQKELVVIFSSKELEDINGTCPILVRF